MKQVSSEVKLKVMSRVHDCIAILEKEYDKSIPFPKLLFTQIGETAGTAHYGTWDININPVLLNENLDAMLEHTVAHELAHLATHIIYPHAHRTKLGCGKKVKRSPHGTEWQEIMNKLGVDPKRTHNFDVSRAVRRKSTTVMYECINCKKHYALGPKRIIALKQDPSAY